MRSRHVDIYNTIMLLIKIKPTITNNWTMIATTLENCRVSPSPSAVTDTYLPLTFYDVCWLTFHPLSRILLYDFPCSKTKFTQTLAPNLKHSLSLALRHFFPLAGNLIAPPNISTTNPQIRYLCGDSVSLTIAECTSAGAHLNHLSGNHARDADELSPLVPQLPQDSADTNSVSGIVSPVFALQLTLFPDQGISIGITNSHVVADGSTIFNFVKAWASFAKHLNSNGGDHHNHDASSLSFQMPFYDRNVIKDPKGLDAIYRTSIVLQIEQRQNNSQHPPTSSNKVRSTFFMYRNQIQVLKNLVFTKLPNLAYASSVTVVCAYLWTCMAKTRAAVGEGMQNEDEPQHFVIAIDCRSRLDPPIPASYFGNCLMPALTHGKRTELVGRGGFYKAVELIGEAIHNKLNNKEGIGVLKDAEFFHDQFEGVFRGEWMMGVAGSPNLDYYNAIDFGFGKAKKFEFVSEPLSPSRCRDSERGDMEIGLQLPKTQMDVFRTVFASEMQDLSNSS